MSEARETRWRSVLGLAAALILIVDVATASAAETSEPSTGLVVKSTEASATSAAGSATAEQNADRATAPARAPMASDRSTAVALFAIALSGGDWRVLMRD